MHFVYDTVIFTSLTFEFVNFGAQCDIGLEFVESGAEGTGIKTLWDVGVISLRGCTSDSQKVLILPHTQFSRQ